jgi:hypothetical protein
VLVTKEEKYPAEAEAAYAKAESEWRQFLLGQSGSPGDAEFHLFLSDVVEDSTGELPQKINWYLARGFDLTPIYSEAGMAGVYAMIVRTLTFSYLTPKAAKDKMIGTQIAEEGVLQTPQTIQRSLGSFIVGRAKAIERFPATLSERQKAKLFERAREEPEKVFRPESFRAFEADQALKKKMRRRLAERSMKGRERNLPCPCGSGKKYKKCHGLK